MSINKLSGHAEWCRNMFDLLAQGGAWGVPRSGLTFIKRGDKLVLTLRMPHDPAMPMTAEELNEYQQSEYELTKREFAKAGIAVIDETCSVSVERKLPNKQE